MPKNGAEFDPDDADADLIPQLVEKVALPILHHEIAHCWDLLSTRVTRNAVSAMSLVVTYVPASSEALQELLATIHTRLADAVANLIVRKSYIFFISSYHPHAPYQSLLHI